MTLDDGLTGDEPGLPRPWEQQTGETDRAYYVFQIYRDLHPLERSASRVRSDLMEQEGRRRSLRWLEEYRSRWAWVDRAKAWDRHQDDVRRRAQIQEHIVMGQRQATEAQALQAAMMIPVRELLKRMTDVMEADAIKRLSVADLMTLAVMTGRVWPTAMRAERIARGAPTPDYGAFLDDPEDADRAGDVVLDTPAHLAEVWLAMEEAGLAPGPRMLGAGPTEPEANGHA